MTRQEALEAILKIKNQSADIRPYWTEVIEVVKIILSAEDKQ